MKRILPLVLLIALTLSIHVSEAYIWNINEYIDALVGYTSSPDTLGSGISYSDTVQFTGARQLAVIIEVDSVGTATFHLEGSADGTNFSPVYEAGDSLTVTAADGYTILYPYATSHYRYRLKIVVTDTLRYTPTFKVGDRINAIQ